MSVAQHPPREPVRSIVSVLTDQGWPVAIGGSAVLAWLGLIDRVRDWDVTVTADPSAVAAVLVSGGFAVTTHANRDHPFASRGWFTVAAPDHDIDVLVGFALRDGAALVSIPVRVAGHWQGLPIAHPGDWELAYRLMGRTDRAEALSEWLAKSD